MSAWASKCLHDLANDPEFIGAKVMLELGELIYALQQRDTEVAALRADNLNLVNDLELEGHRLETLRADIERVTVERDTARADIEYAKRNMRQQAVDVVERMGVTPEIVSMIAALPLRQGKG